MMEQLFASGHAIDIVLAVLAIEAIWLHRRNWALRDIMTTLGPAVLILLGTRAALTGAAWIWVSLPLAASFPLHLADLVRQTKKAGTGR
jgi:hypothetical protein